MNEQIRIDIGEAMAAEHPTNNKLKEIIYTVDNLSQDGFSEISTLANMALDLMETERAYLCPETLAQVLRTISAKAEDIENLINCEAESVGCNYKDKAVERRRNARCAAETRMKEHPMHSINEAHKLISSKEVSA